MPAGKARKLAEVKRSVSDTRKAFRAVDKTEKTLARMKPLLLKSAAELIPRIRAMLVTNYIRSGLRTRSGKLKNTIANADVWVSDKAISIAFPAGIPKSPNGDWVYVYGASLHHGAVRAPRKRRRIRDSTGKVDRIGVASVLGENAKRSVKRSALKKLQREGRALDRKIKRAKRLGFKDIDSKRARASLARTALKLDFAIGKISVIPPKPFFDLSPDQVDRLEAMLLENFQKRINQSAKAA